MLKNADIIKNSLQSIYNIVGEKTSYGFAVAIIDTITRTLKQRFTFLDYIIFDTKDNPGEVITLDPAVNSVDPVLVGRAIAAIVQVVYMDLKDIVGLYFIKELQRNAGEEVISSLKDVGVDLELLQIQQNYLYRQQKRIEKNSIGGKENLPKNNKEKSLLDYSWEKVSDCVYDADSRVCTIIGQDGEVLDRLDLDNIVKKYLGKLTEEDINSN